MRPITRNDSARRGARAALRRGGPDRTHRAYPARATRWAACVARRGRVDGRRAAVRSGGDGRLRGHRRGHVRRRPLRPEDAALRRNGLHGPGARRARRPRRVHRDRHRRAAAGRRRRRRDGRGNREESERTRSGSSRRSIRASTSGGAPPTSRPGQTVLAAGDRAEPQPHRRAGGNGHHARSRSTPARASRSSRPATRSSSPGQPLGPGQIYDINRFTLLVDHRRRTAACRSSIRPRQTRSRS